MRTTALFFLFLVSTVVSLCAQTLTTNDKGEQIIVYPDGSWRYFVQPKSDKQTTEMSTSDSGMTPGDEAKPSSNAVQSSPTSSSPFAFQNTLTEDESSSEDIAVAEARARSIVRKQLTKQRKTVKKLGKALAKKRKKENSQRDQLEAFKAKDNNLKLDELDILNRRLQEAKQQRLQTEEEFENASAVAEILLRSLPMTRKKREEYFAENGLIKQASLSETVDKPSQQAEVIKPENSSLEFTQDQADDEFTSSTKSTEYLTYDYKRDPRISPPLSDCIYTYDGIDEFTQKRRRDLPQEVFFAHTTDELKPYMGANSLITAAGNLVKSGSTIIFEVDYVIRSQFANREFGVLPASSPLTMKLVGGSTVILKNLQLSQGVFDPVEKTFTYHARYPISSSQEKTLRKNLIDQVRVMWGTGFEDYTVFEVNFFQRQLRCL